MKKGDEWVYPNGKGRYEFINRVADEFGLNLRGPSAEWGVRANKILSHRAYLLEMQSAWITIGYNHIDLERYYTRRVILSGASGRLLVTRYIQGMEKYFDVRNINKIGPIWFHDNEEGIKLIRYYLEKPELWWVRSKSQRKIFLREHSWKARLYRFEQVALKLLERKIECISQN